MSDFFRFIVPQPNATHMSPRWGFRYLVYPVCYKHAAPLGLNAKTGKSENGIGLIRVCIVGTTMLCPTNRLT